MYNRYSDIEKFITDPDKLQLVNGSEVYISSEDDYDIAVDCQGCIEEFEQIKPFIVLVAQNICELDNMAQKFDNLHSGNRQFPYIISTAFIDRPHVILEYWGTEENTQFQVVFEHDGGVFKLESFGMIMDIPSDWEERMSLKQNCKKQDAKRGFWSKWFHFR